MIVIMGPGRCGTTLAVELLIEMGFDSGGAIEIFREIRHSDLRSKRFEWPELVKGTGTLCMGLDRWMKEGKWDVEVIILCYRDFEANKESLAKFRRGHGIYKGMTKAQRLKVTDKDLPKAYAKARRLIAKSGKRCVEINFPRSARDVDYCYETLCEAVGPMDRDEFNAAWKKIVDPSKIRNGG